MWYWYQIENNISDILFLSVGYIKIKNLIELYLDKNKCGDFGFKNNQRSRIQKWQETYITHNGLKEFPKIINACWC